MELSAVRKIVHQPRKRHGEEMFERLLEPGCTESPACQCGEAMQIASIEVLPEGSDAAVRGVSMQRVRSRNAPDRLGDASSARRR